MGDQTIRKVLAVDDEESILRGYRSGFRDRQCFTTSNVEEAVKLATGERPELVIVDLRIGRAWGIGLIHRIRARLPDAFIVLVSGFVSVGTAVGAIRAGADHVLTKPASAANILRELEGGEPGDDPDDGFPSLARVEWEHIMRALAEFDGNITKAAKRLGMRRTSLQRKLKKRPPAS